MPLSILSQINIPSLFQVDTPDRNVDYKILKEDFVSNLTGGEISEINYVTTVAAVGVVVWSVLQSRQSFFASYGSLSFLVDFALNVGAILLAITLYSSMPIGLSLLLLAPTFFTYLLPAFYPRKQNARPWSSKKDDNRKPEALEELPMKPFLTTYRGSMMVATCVAILAVDFRIFPRKFAKSENWGTSLMDLGVGSFVFSAGLVAARPLLKEKLSRGGKRGKGLGIRLFRSARHSLPLIVLGLIRLYSVKGLDYAEHVSEYGVHWNFFFTLGLLPPFVALFQSAFELVPSHAALALLLAATYQAVLEFTDLKAFILTAPRTDLLSKNREGIFSFFGYLAVFLAGQNTGMYVIPRRIRKIGSPDGHTQRMRLLVTMTVWSLFWTALYVIASSYNYGFALTVSRRIANLPYFLWIAAFNTSQLTLFCGIETFFFPAFYKAADKAEEKRIYNFATSKVLAAYNRNGLAVFLIANLLTGLINMTIPTLYLNDLQAMVVLLLYSLTLTGVAVGLDIADVSIKM